MTDPADQTEAMAGAQITDHLHRADTVVLGGRYELTERIASGGMAAVWRAHDEVLARPVAVKLLHDHLAADEAFRERFRREAIAAAKLTHPHVVSLYDTGTDGDRVYLVMEYIDGATLREVISDLGRLEPGQAAAIGEKIARALEYAHERGLVHRDIKPANILLGDDGTVKVADFGIVKAEEHDGDLTKTGMVLGTAAYVAPEQITGDSPLDGRADQYALGCMLYEALTGQQPFKGETAVATAAKRLESGPPPLRSVRPDVPRGLDAVVMRAMSRHPDQRFVSTGAFADALAAFADSDPNHTAALPLATTHRASGHASGPRHAPVAEPEPYHESFLRTEGRWLLPVIAMLVMAVVLIGGGIATGVLDPSELPGVGGRDDAESADRSSNPESLDIAEAVAFDPPPGDGTESDSMLPGLLDDDESSAWRTEGYNTADFGALKDGVGFYVDLGEQRDIAAVELDAVHAGVSGQIRVADDPAATLDGWDRVGDFSAAGDTITVEVDEDVSARYVLVWVVAPLPQDGRYRAEFSGIQVLGWSEDDDT